MFKPGDICKAIETYEHPLHRKYPCERNLNCCFQTWQTISENTIAEILVCKTTSSTFVWAWLPQMNAYVHGTYANHFVKISK